jgi:hypothetical protein
MITREQRELAALLADGHGVHVLTDLARTGIPTAPDLARIDAMIATGRRHPRITTKIWALRHAVASELAR